MSLAYLNHFVRTPASDDPYCILERLKGWRNYCAAADAKVELLYRIICKKATKIKRGRKEDVNKEERAKALPRVQE
jgi:hypothetical protein